MRPKNFNMQQLKEENKRQKQITKHTNIQKDDLKFTQVKRLKHLILAIFSKGKRYNSDLIKQKIKYKGTQ